MPRPPQNDPTRRGLTLIETMLAVTLSGLVILAAAGFTFALESGRRASDAWDTAVLSEARADARLRQVIEPTRQVLDLAVGDVGDPEEEAYLLVWVHDTWEDSYYGVVAGDGRVQRNELALVRYAPNDGRVLLTEGKPLTLLSMTERQEACVEVEDAASLAAARIALEGGGGSLTQPVPVVGTDDAPALGASFEYEPVSDTQTVATVTYSVAIDNQVGLMTGTIQLRSAGG